MPFLHGLGQQPPHQPTELDLYRPLRIPRLFSPPPGPVHTLSPLGEPLNETSADYLTRFPLVWHLIYWLSLGVIGIMRGEDTTLMALLIEIELQRIPDVRLNIQLSHQWNQFKINYREEFQQFWAQQTLECAEAKAYLRDIDRILMDKVRKAREYLPRGERMMIHAMRNGDTQIARNMFERVCGLYQILGTIDAETREEDRNQLPSSIYGAQDYEGQGIEFLEADSDESSTLDGN